MNKKHKKTLSSVFSSPIPRNISFRDLEGLLKAVGCILEEGHGSRVLFSCDGVFWPTHRPHPQKEAKLYQIKEARDFLIALGVQP